MQPLIAVVGRRLGRDSVRGWPHAGALAVADPYLDALRRAGGREAVLYPVDIDGGEAADLVRRFDGLVFVGGSDVDPAQYGAAPHPATRAGDPIQDRYEIALALAAIDAGVALLAICRGVQVLNVALGGTLIQHLPDRPGTGPHTLAGASEAGGRHDHVVHLVAASQLAQVMGTTQPVCPSSHHQAIDELGKDLAITGTAPDGVVEAVEHESRRVLGVQWHPESSAHRDPCQQALFDTLVQWAAEG